MKKRTILPIVAVILLSLGLAIRSFSSQTAASPTLHGDKAHPAKASGWVDTKLYFGLGPDGEPEKGVTETGWRAFLDKEVTPRFPDGLSVFDVYGQWQG